LKEPFQHSNKATLGWPFCFALNYLLEVEPWARARLAPFVGEIVELRGAPFVGWIKDLSTYDPWFVTPVLMGLTQFVQQKMTPATGDPVQQRMMLFMPLIFMTMFIWAPSGLVLYWTMSNLWAIGQQVLTNRLIGPPPQRTGGAAAERRMKQAGGGKTDAAKERK